MLSVLSLRSVRLLLGVTILALAITSESEARQPRLRNGVRRVASAPFRLFPRCRSHAGHGHCSQGGCSR